MAAGSCLHLKFSCCLPGSPLKLHPDVLVSQSELQPGLVGSISYISSCMAGLPFFLFLQHDGWGALFTSIFAVEG